MKKILTFLIFCFAFSAIGQNCAECGVDDNPKLTQAESAFLNEYMTENNRQHLDFTDKKVIFVTGNSGHQFGTKSIYFDKIKERKPEEEKIATWIVKLTDEEKMKSGYDVIVTYWVKIITERRKRKILSEMKVSR